MLLELLLSQILATLDSMSLPDNLTSAGQALKHQAQSPAEPQIDQASVKELNQCSEVQLKPQQGIKTAKCDIFPLYEHWTVIIDLANWDPDKDGKAEEFKKHLQEKCGKDNFADFWWKKFPDKTKFRFHVPYPAKDRMKGDMFQLVADALFQYSKLRTKCWHF